MSIPSAINQLASCTNWNIVGLISDVIEVSSEEDHQNGIVTLIEGCTDAESSQGVDDCLKDLQAFSEDEDNPMAQYINDIMEDPVLICSCNRNFNRKIPACVFEMGSTSLCVFDNYYPDSDSDSESNSNSDSGSACLEMIWADSSKWATMDLLPMSFKASSAEIFAWSSLMFRTAAFLIRSIFFSSVLVVGWEWEENVSIRVITSVTSEDLRLRDVDEGGARGDEKAKKG